MKFFASRFGTSRCTLVAGLASFVVAGVALADGHVYTATNPAWKAECCSCHVAYPPALLPAASWRALMMQLDQHFGTDASIDAKTAREITAFLEANAGRARKETGATPVLRITETRWFQKEHDEIPARTRRSPAVKSAADCEACHTQAAQGNFSERTLRAPR